MNAIGNIFLTWRAGKGSRRIPVGVIKKNATEGIRFNYIKDGIEEAKKHGFASYESFPDTSKEYTNEVIEIFGKRIVNTERNDLQSFYDFWKIDTRYKNDKYYMLAYTQGMLPTDNFEFLADFKPVRGLSFITELSNLSHLKLPLSTLSIGNTLTYILEKNNEQDKNAVKVFKEKTEVGYIKKIHCNVFSKTTSKFNVKVHHIEKNGKINRAFLHVYL
jgi:hypothetical protein